MKRLDCDPEVRDQISAPGASVTGIINSKWHTHTFSSTFICLFIDHFPCFSIPHSFSLFLSPHYHNNQQTAASLALVKHIWWRLNQIQGRRIAAEQMGSRSREKEDCSEYNISAVINTSTTRDPIIHLSFDSATLINKGQLGGERLRENGLLQNGGETIVIFYSAAAFWYSVGSTWKVSPILQTIVYWEQANSWESRIVLEPESSVVITKTQKCQEKLFKSPQSACVSQQLMHRCRRTERREK